MACGFIFSWLLTHSLSAIRDFFLLVGKNNLVPSPEEKYLKPFLSFKVSQRRKAATAILLLSPLAHYSRSEMRFNSLFHLNLQHLSPRSMPHNQAVACCEIHLLKPLCFTYRILRVKKKEQGQGLWPGKEAMYCKCHMILNSLWIN